MPLHGEHIRGKSELNRKIGFIINPIAGMGGKVALKGTDGEQTLLSAIKNGAVAESHIKAKRALERLADIKNEITILTASGSMGENLCKSLGMSYEVVYKLKYSKTTYTDTEEAAKKIKESGAKIIIFAGGDGTARNIYNAVKNHIPVIGIPAGVKIQSAVFSQNPEYAGDLVYEFVKNANIKYREMEVIDLNEEDYKNRHISSTLYGYMKVPYFPKYIQNMKQSGFNTDESKSNSVADYVIKNMNDDFYYIIGSGSTAKIIMEKLNLRYELLGIDVIYQKKVVINDATENQLFRIISEKKVKIIVSPIGGQGYIFGRGNHQISDRIIMSAGKDSIIVVATDVKLLSIKDSRLKVDCENPGTNEYLKGYYNVVTGFGRFISMPCC